MSVFSKIYFDELMLKDIFVLICARTVALWMWFTALKSLHALQNYCWALCANLPQKACTFITFINTFFTFLLSGLSSIFFITNCLFFCHFTIHVGCFAAKLFVTNEMSEYLYNGNKELKSWIAWLLTLACALCPWELERRHHCSCSRNLCHSPAIKV